MPGRTSQGNLHVSVHRKDAQHPSDAIPGSFAPITVKIGEQQALKVRRKRLCILSPLENMQVAPRIEETANMYMQICSTTVEGATKFL